MNKRVLFGLTLTAISVITIPTLPTLAQTQTRISDLQQRAYGITVSGKVTQAVGNNFIIDDSTGQLIVDAGPRWWREINLKPGELVTVTGELGRGGELDAFSITREDGSVVDIRPTQGPPPWAGGPNRNRFN
ncbi:DNA-binding protein [Fischerella thermalis]|uniref:DNA-binding protein n=1 Tax=Fischerella thermalis CCMEE 5318 TaxID=2019666 RepID=A0A2N6LHH6_9CYAN|nr:DNA-binding protein [Fischerella thermalis]PMB22466.1 DNA-binding protein [Fischerella thermalis CCMEE 5319]PMB23447.1 DNA-binding protein [Fischerella thermalis CCMEE 5318]